MKINIDLVIACLALAGCAVISDIAATNKDIESGAAVNTIKQVQLNSTEELIVNHALNKYIAFTEKWSMVRVAPDKNEFIADFGEVKEQYLAVEDIVEAHWDEYPAEQQKKLKEYRKSARDLNRSVSILILTNKLYFALQDAVDMSKTLIGLAKAL